MTGQELVVVQLRVSVEVGEQLKAAAVLRRMSVAKLAGELIAGGLKRLPPPVDLFGDPISTNGTDS